MIGEVRPPVYIGSMADRAQYLEDRKRTALVHLEAMPAEKRRDLSDPLVTRAIVDAGPAALYRTLNPNPDILRIKSRIKLERDNKRWP